MTDWEKWVVGEMDRLCLALERHSYSEPINPNNQSFSQMILHRLWRFEFDTDAMIAEEKERREQYVEDDIDAFD